MAFSCSAGTCHLGNQNLPGKGAPKYCQSRLVRPCLGFNYKAFPAPFQKPNKGAFAFLRLCARLYAHYAHVSSFPSELSYLKSPRRAQHSRSETKENDSMARFGVTERAPGSLCCFWLYIVFLRLPVPVAHFSPLPVFLPPPSHSCHNSYSYKSYNSRSHRSHA